MQQTRPRGYTQAAGRPSCADDDEPAAKKQEEEGATDQQHYWPPPILLEHTSISHRTCGEGEALKFE